MRKYELVKKIKLIEMELNHLKKELKRNKVISDFDSGLSVDIPRLKEMQELILNYLNVEIAYGYKKLKKKE